jgi:hypothetical protein
MNLSDPLHGLGNEAFPAVYESEKSIRFAQVGSLIVSITNEARQFVEPFIDAVNLAQASNLAIESELALSWDLYCLASEEVSERARFLTLVTALEVLVRPTRRPPEVVALIDAWIDQVGKRLRCNQGNVGMERSLRALQAALMNLRDESIGAGIRSFVRQTFRKVDDAEAENLAKRAGQLYQLRSRISHRGEAQLSGELSELKSLVEQILLVLLGQKR